MTAHPTIQASVDGVPVAGAFFDRLVSLTVIDREGIQSDTVELTFNDAAPHIAAPRRGAMLHVSILSGPGAGFDGTYVIDRVEYGCLPYTITVKGHSADLRAGLKSSKTRHWDAASVKTIVQSIAADNGLQVRISEAVSGHLYDWIGQQDESDLNFLDRMAQRHGALFTIKNGVLLWLERGTGKTADGATIPPAVVLLPSIIAGSCRMSETDVDRFATVKAYWQDRAGARRQEVVVAADKTASGEYVLRDPFGSRAEAAAACAAAAREMTRGLIEVSCAVIGRPALMAGQPLVFQGVRFGLDGRAFILETVTHSFTKSGGLRTAFTGRLRVE